MACAANTSSNLPILSILLAVLLRGNNQIRRSQGIIAHHQAGCALQPMAPGRIRSCPMN